MKVKRLKRIRKYMEYYCRKYKFKEPYNLVVDADFIRAALAGKILLREQMPRYLCGPVEIHTTRCVMRNLKAGGKFDNGAVKIAESMPYAMCRHPEDSQFTPTKCLQLLFANGNPKKWCVGAQDVELRAAVRKADVPLLFIQGQVPLMERPSGEAFSLEDSEAQKKLSEEEQALKKLKQEELERKKLEKPLRKKKPKGPNPLSVKKKKADPKKQPQQQQQGKQKAEAGAGAQPLAGKKRRHAEVEEASGPSPQGQQAASGPASAAPEGEKKASASAGKNKRQKVASGAVVPPPASPVPAAAGQAKEKQEKAKVPAQPQAVANGAGDKMSIDDGGACGDAEGGESGRKGRNRKAVRERQKARKLQALQQQKQQQQQAKP